LNYGLEVEPLDLGADVRAIGLELTETDETREPARGSEAARAWSRILRSVAGEEPLVLDFFSHLDRVKQYCATHNIEVREAAARCVVMRAPTEDVLAGVIERFEGETFGARAGARVASGDTAVENEISRRGVDAYHAAFPEYFFCAVCSFEDASLTILSKALWASEVIRRVKPALAGLAVEVRLPV
jgi:hypothetical protein